MNPFRFGACSRARVCSRDALHHKRQVPLVTAGLSGRRFASSWMAGSEVFNRHNMSESLRAVESCGQVR